MSFVEFQNQVNSTRDASEELREGLKKSRQRASNLKRKKAQLLREIGIEGRENDRRWVKINQAEAEAERSKTNASRQYTRAIQEEWEALKELISFTNPIENIASLPDDTPILLFPLRLETRFKKIQRDGVMFDQLWVRVFPDDIAINSFESDLSDAEIRDIQTYWLARWKVGQDKDGNRGAWRSLAAAHGSGRAYWLTINYIPLNIAGEPEIAEGEIILAIGTQEALAGPELGAVIDYWKAVWQADKDSTKLDAAWDKLLEDVSEERATSLVSDYKPANLNDPPPAGRSRDETVVRVEFVIFPATDELETKLHAWSQPPRTTILPERFVFLAFQNGELAMPPQLGNLVPPELILGPDPAAEQGEDFRLATKEDAEADPNILEGDLIFSENMRWMFDFEEAVARGMGFKIDLTSAQAADGFERVFVLGLKLSASKEKGQTLLEELFEQHHYSRKGFAILKQGTPTNNTEEDDSGYSWRHDPDESFDVYFNETDAQEDPTDWFNKRDGRWLAEMLGINPSSLQSVENYYQTDISEGLAMQRALWPATLGHFMDSMLNPVFSAQVIEQTRQFFTQYINGRGFLPAIRVGRQPYGILPATNYMNMGWFRHRAPDNRLSIAPLFAPGVNFLVNLYRILLDMDQTWMNLLTRVSHVGKQGDAQEILLDIVGLHPASVEVYKRYANSLKQVHNIYNVNALNHNGLFTYYPGTLVTAEALLARYGYTIDAEHPEPEIIKKSFFENAWILKGDRIDRVPNSEVDPIGIYTTDDKNYITWLIEASEESHDRLRLQDGFIDDKPPTALLYLLLYHALDLSFVDTSLKLHLNRGIMTPVQMRTAYIEPDFIHIEENKETESRWKYLYTSDVRITGDPDLMVGSYIPQHIDTLDEAAAFRDVLAGLRMLQDVPTARLERLMMEHIDTVSYRLDAWILGYLHLQLQGMRGLSTSDTESTPRQGLYIGAFGWLENLRPEGKVLTPVELPEELNEVFNPQGDLVEDATNAGFILAPSQNHAVTAAVLRNGHLSNEDPEEKEELKIKLSSERVRLALKIIEGIQGGQTLAALLGYQFERGLHDRTDAEVDEFIFELRNAFPLVAKKFKDTTPGTEDPEYESIDQIEARNVMDGVAFLEHIEESDNMTYPFGLSLPDATLEQAAAINQEVLRLIEVNDAVADLALAESVHQVVLGNYERAAATLDTYSKGNFPPTPEVIKTPRSGTQLTHRVALQFRTGLSHNLGDPGVTPRMVAEPAMHDWLSRIMPGMDEIVCLVSYFDRDTESDAERQISLEDIGLAHIDALYLLNIESDQAMSALDDRIIQYVTNDAGFSPRMDEMIHIEYTRKLDIDKFTVFEITSLVASLRALLLRSKPLTAADVRRANEASKENEQTLSLDATRLEAVITELAGLRTNALQDYIDNLSAIIATEIIDNIINELDVLMSDLAVIFTQVSDFGIAQTGTGFIYQWHQGMYIQLRAKVEELIARLEEKRTEYTTLRTEYNAKLLTGTEEELFAILTEAELKISTTSTAHLYTDSGNYFADIDGIKFVQFEAALDNTIKPILDLHNLTDLFQEILSAAALLPAFDVVGIGIDDQLILVDSFANDLLSSAQNLSQEMLKRETSANDLLTGASSTADAVAKVDLIKNAARAIFGGDFVIVPQFTLEGTQGTEWQNTLIDSQNSLRYLLNDMDMDFPMDDWLYGVSRVREKLYHVENTLIHIEGFNGTSLSLVPSQFPYREEDYWLGLQYPDKKPGTEEPFTIDEDKLLFTSIYTEVFNPGNAQCGLLLDEWTEVIPARDETLGLTFHYDQPNTEPPQTLLLVTPSDFTGSWRWEDLVNTLHETLDMAKKRAVEPDDVDTTVYSRFLPPIVSLTSPLPLTATLNLALNNQVFFAKVVNDE